VTIGHSNGAGAASDAVRSRGDAVSALPVPHGECYTRPQRDLGLLPPVIGRIAGWWRTSSVPPIIARRAVAGSAVVAVIPVPLRLAVVATLRSAVAPVAAIASKLAVHVADVADTTIHILQRGSAPASVGSAAVGDQSISINRHMTACAQIRSWGHTLAVHGQQQETASWPLLQSDYICRSAVGHSFSPPFDLFLSITAASFR
jgi:hypothetical protein